MQLFALFSSLFFLGGGFHIGEISKLHDIICCVRAPWPCLFQLKAAFLKNKLAERPAIFLVLKIPDKLGDHVSDRIKNYCAACRITTASKLLHYYRDCCNPNCMINGIVPLRDTSNSLYSLHSNYCNHVANSLMLSHFHKKE